MEDTQIMDYTQDIDNDFEDDQNSIVAWLEIDHHKYELREGSMKIGRDPVACKIVLSNEKTISKEHAIFEVDKFSVTLTDLGSRNKTRIGKMALKPQVRYALDGKKELRFGAVKGLFIINTHVADTDSDTCSESMLELSSSSPTKNLSANSNNGEDNSMISPTPQTSTKSLQELGKELVSKKSLDYIPETPAAARGSTSSNAGVSQAVVMESPNTQSTPYSNISRVGLKNFISPCSPVHLSPISVSNKPWNTTNLKLNLDCSNADDEESKKPHTSGEKAKKNSGNFSPNNNEENYNSDESTDVEDLFNEDQSKDDSPKAPPKNEPSKQHVVESEERCSSSHKEGEGEDDNTQDILDAFEEEDNTQDILHAFKEPAEEEEEEDLTENEKQPFDKTESGTIFKKPSPFLKLKKVTPKVKSSLSSFNDDDVYNMPTQRFPMKNEEPDSTFETPTQMFDAPTQVFGAHTKLDAPTQVFKTPTKVDAPTDVFDAPTQAFDTPTQAFDAPTQAFDAPTQVFGAPTQVFDAPTQVFDAPTQVFDAPTQVFDAPTQVFDAPTQVFDAPTQVFDAPPQVFETRLPVLEIKTEGCNSPLSPLNSSIASDVGNETTQVFNNDHRHVDDSDENRYPDTVPIADAAIEEPLCEDKYPENVEEAARISKNCQTKLIAESTSSPSNDAPLNPNIKNENILTEPRNSNTNLAEYDDDTDSSTSETLLETRENDSSSLEQTVVFAHSQVVSPLSGSNKDSKEQKNNEGTSLNKSNSAFDIADTVPVCEGEKDASDGESDTSETLLINVKDENKSITSSSVKGKSSLNMADTIQFCEDKQSDSDNGSDTSETLLDVNDKKLSTRSPSKSASSDSADTLPFCQNEKADIDKNNSNTSKTNETTVIISSKAAAALTKIEMNSDLGGGTASERDYNSDESTDIEEGNNEFPHVSKTTSGNENLEKDSFSKHSKEECKTTDCQEEYNSDESTDIEEDRQILAPTLVAKTPEQGHSRACVEEIVRTGGKTEVIEDDVVTPAHKDTPTVVSVEVTQDVSRAESDISKLELTGGSDILPDRIDHHNKAESNTNSEAKCLASSSPQIIDTHSGLQEDFQTECSETPNLSYSNFQFVSRDNTPILKSGDDELIPTTKNAAEGVCMQIREDAGTSDSESSIENSAKKSVHLFSLTSEDEEESQLNLNPEKRSRSMPSRAIARHLDFDFEDVETKKSECSEPHEKNTFKDSAVITSNKSQKIPALSSDSSLPVNSTPGRITASLKDSTEIVEKEGGSKNCGEEVKNDHKADSLKPNDVVSETSSNDATKHQTDERKKTLLNHTSTIISNSEKEKNKPSKSPSGSNEEADLKSLKSQTRQVVKPCNNRKRPPRSSSQEEEIIEPKRGRRLTRSRKQTSSSEVRTTRTDKGNGEILNSPKTSTSSEVDESPLTNDSTLKLPLQPALSVEKNGVANRASSSLPSLEEDDNSEAKRPTTRGGRKRTAPNRYSPSKLLQASSNNGNRRSKRTKVEEEEIHLQDAKTEHDNNYKVTAQTSLRKNNKPDTSNKSLSPLEKMKPSSCRDSEEKESPSKDKKKKTACEETEGEDKTSKLVMKKPLNEPDNRTRNSVTTNDLTVRGRRTRRNMTECGNTDKIVIKSPPKKITAKSSCEGFSGNASNTNLSERIEQSQFDKGSEEKETTEDRKVVTTSMKAEVEMEEASKVAVEKQLRELSKRTRNSVAKNNFSAQRRQTRRNVNENSNTAKIGRRTALAKNNNETPPVEDAFDKNSETERMEQSSLGRGRKRKTFTEDNPSTVCKQAEKENTVSVAAADKPLKASQKCTRNSSPTNDFTDRGRRTRRNMTDHDNTDKIVKGAPSPLIEIKSPFKGFHRDASDKKLRNERTELSPLNKGGKETSARDKKAAPCKQTEREDIDSEIVANKTLKKVKTKAGNVTATTNDSTTQGRQTRRGTAPSESIRTTIVSGKRSSSRNSQTSERSTASLPQLEAELVVCHPSSSSNLHHKGKSEKEPVLKKTGRRSGGISVSNIKPKSTRPRRGLCELESEMEISTISESSESEVSSNHSTKRPLSPAKSTRSIRSRNRASSPFLKDEVILWSPSQRQALASKRPRVLFTGFKDTKDEKIVKDAGGILVETATECSVLVTNAIKRTCKLMACLGKGIPIVSTEWINACKQSGNFVDPWNYIVCDRAAETKFGFSLSQSLKLAAKKSLLSGYSIYVTDSVKPTPEEMKEIIVCAGGHFLETPPVLSAANTVVISCPQDKKSWTQYKKLKLDIVNTEFILTGLLKQKILIQENKLS